MPVGFIRSGGQTGADRGALDAAREAGAPICGWCPKGGWAEDMPEAPGLLARYPELSEAPSPDPAVRTEWNVRDSDATLIVCPGVIATYSGTHATFEFAQLYDKPYFISDGTDCKKALVWLDGLADGRSAPLDLNVAGPRESGFPGVYRLAKDLVARLLEDLPPSCTVQEAMLDDLVACEFNRFSVNDYRGLPSASEFEIAGGKLPAIVSAPHAVTCVRDGKVKPSEDFTGAIALAVAKRTGCHAIVATRTGGCDPNWDELAASPYKRALCQYVRENCIRLAIDLHGMVAASPTLVAVGSADGETVAMAPELDGRVARLLRGELDPYCERHGKPVALNGKYAARGRNTVARTVARECGIPALQVEVATQLRVPVGRHGRMPEGEPVPFSGAQLPAELAARRAAEPAAVGALVDALCKVVMLGLK